MAFFKEDYPLLAHNTFHLPAKARYFVEYLSVEQLKAALKSSVVQQNALLHIGSGSNLLFTQDFNGVVLHSAICGIVKVNEDDQYVYLKAGAGVVWDEFVAYCADHELYGSENLSLIPGEVGAAAVQNIGAYGVEIKDLIEEVFAVEIATGEEKIFPNSACQYAYRESIFKKELKNQYIITHVLFRLKKKGSFNLEYGNIKESLTGDEPITLKRVRECIISIRMSKLPDPHVMGNAGSFFMNPYVAKAHYETLKKEFPTLPHYPISETEVKVPAAWLIEQCGWKGKIIGDASVHEKQCLVIVNRGQAKASDIVTLSAEIQKSVAEKFAIQLTPEVIFI